MAIRLAPLQQSIPCVIRRAHLQQLILSPIQDEVGAFAMVIMACILHELGKDEWIVETPALGSTSAVMADLWASRTTLAERCIPGLGQVPTRRRTPS